jgi:hypothetical protein
VKRAAAPPHHGRSSADAAVSATGHGQPSPHTRPLGGPAAGSLCQGSFSARLTSPAYDSAACSSASSAGGVHIFYLLALQDELCHRGFDDGNVLLRRSAADSDAGHHLALAGERHATSHRRVSAARDSEEGIEGRAGLHERN